MDCDLNHMREKRDHGPCRAKVVAPIVGDKVMHILDTSVERRWYANGGPAILAKRRDWRFATYLGLDLAGAFARRHWLRDLSVGVEWLEVSSNVEDADRSELVLLPAVSVGISF